MKSAKGYMLAEIIFVLSIFALTVAMTAPMLPALVNDLPKTWNAIEVNASVADVLRHIRDDMDAASDLPTAVGKIAAGADRILIKQSERVICYEIDGDKITRRTLSAKSGASQSWILPTAKFSWRVSRQPGRVPMVEIDTYIAWQKQGKSEQRLANSYMLFPALAEPGVPNK